MDPVQTAAQAYTWVDFAILVWKDVWGYAATTGIGLIAGLFLPQLKIGRKDKTEE